MPKSRTRKKSGNTRPAGPSTSKKSRPLESLLGSDLRLPGASYAAELSATFVPAEEYVETHEQDFAIRIGPHVVRWAFWPQCVAATKAGSRCLQPAAVENPGPYRDGAFVIHDVETYGSRWAETFRRLLTQRCHLHDNETASAVAFEGRVEATSRSWLEELQLVASADALRAEKTRTADRERLTATECPTCGVVGSLKCMESSGRPKAKGFHTTRLQAAFGRTNHGRLPII